MITFVRGDIFTSPAKVLVNTVNTVGVMGKGLAKIFKDIYPEMFREYQQLCERNQFSIGQLWLYRTSHKWILNFPTKQHWRHPSQPDYIDAGLRKFAEIYSDHGITSVAFPKLGCGNGELDWEKQVKPLMIKFLEPLPIDIFIYEDDISYAPEHKDIGVMSAWLRGEPRSLAFVEMWSDLRTIVGQKGASTSIWDGDISFRAFVTDEGLQIELEHNGLGWFIDRLAKLVPKNWRFIGPKDIFIPREAILDLWQSIRAYGFCSPRIMPEGLDIFAPYIMALLARLSYMKPVELTTRIEKEPSKSEKALQLFTYPATEIAESFRAVHAVQPV